MAPPRVLRLLALICAATAVNAVSVPSSSPPPSPPPPSMPPGSPPPPPPSPPPPNPPPSPPPKSPPYPPPPVPPPSPPPSPPPHPPPSPPPPLGSGLLFPGYFCGNIHWPVATKVRDPADCAGELAATEGWKELTPYFSWSPQTQNCYGCDGAQTSEREKRVDGFNIYRTGDYASRLPSTKVVHADTGCGRLITKTAASATECAAATVAAGSLPFFSYSDESAFCFACLADDDQAAAAPGYNVYASNDFPIAFEEITRWAGKVPVLSLLAERSAAGATTGMRNSQLKAPGGIVLVAVAVSVGLAVALAGRSSRRRSQPWPTTRTTLQLVRNLRRDNLHDMPQRDNLAML
mmetsp:Transcript_21994/g.68483  ORF Transcript_21994/g.68483 Transcript_21994/m.68483 type:complete len:349 (+) Transcript_21994:139-1185(+)